MATSEGNSRRTIAVRSRVFCCALLAAIVGHSGIYAESGPPTEQAIVIQSDYAQSWEDDGRQVTLLRGRCRIVQGSTVGSARQMVVWQRRRSRKRAAHLVVYLEGDARIDRPGRTFSEETLVAEFATNATVDIRARRHIENQPGEHDPLYRRAGRRNTKTVRPELIQVQLAVPEDNDTAIESYLPQPSGRQMRRIRISPRNFSIPYSVESFESTGTTPPEQVAVLKGGINLLIEGIEDYGTIDLTADRMVIWTESGQLETLDLENRESFQARDAPFQVYLEGDIVIRQGKTTVRAKQAFYDARDDRGLLIDAHLKTPLLDDRLHVRVRADRIRQHSQSTFHAERAWVTTSEFGKPGYRIEASDIFLEQRQVPGWIGRRGNSFDIDPRVGDSVNDEVPWVTSLNNAVLIDDFPILFAPHISSPAADPGIPLKRISVGHNRVMGGELQTTWNAAQIFGVDLPAGTIWDLELGGMTERGVQVGTRTEYRGRDSLFLPGDFSGAGHVTFLHDSGNDNLGRDRRSLTPENNERWRLSLQHRQDLPYQMALQGELGVVSDRNFLEQFYESEFDEGKDQENLLYLKQDVDNLAWTLTTRTQLNDFENTTEWYPRGDVYVLGEPLFGGLLRWSSHSSAGYGRLRLADAPTDMTDIFRPLPFVANLDGAVLMSRHQVNLPLQLGPVKVVPYVMGEAAHWGETFGGGSLDRLFGTAGVSATLMMWRLFPEVHSHIFNLNGLVHKMLLEANYSITDSNTDLAGVPQYNEFDDNAQERFRQRLIVNTFGGMLPGVYEPRMYAVRSGAGASVTAPYHELVDDQQVLRLNWRHRWQTKVGPPDRLRTKDWMVLNLSTSFFPRPGRDNFGESFGLYGAEYQWNVGDRTSLLASASYDTFDDAQQLWNVGILSQRDLRGSIYAGIRQVKGAGLDSQIVTASYSYSMSSKWISTLGTAYDLGENENRGQSLTITRVGADFLVHVGASYDQSKDNAVIAVSIEPKLGPLNGSSTQLGSLLHTDRPR